MIRRQPRFIKSVSKLSNLSKVFLSITTLLVVISVFKKASDKNELEGFTQSQRMADGVKNSSAFLFKRGVDIYDDFYANVYDLLVFSDSKNNFEADAIASTIKPHTRSIILDVGSGTGHHVDALSKRGVKNIMGIDTSISMISQARKSYPNHQFIQGDVLDKNVVKANTFTHITCLYFTAYYLENKLQFFNNCYKWLQPGGLLFVHLVDKDLFDPVLPSGNPLQIVSPQKYAKERITSTKVIFDDFNYYSNFESTESNNRCIFGEKFKFKDGTTRKNEHTMYIEPTEDIVQIAKKSGFVVNHIIDLVKCAYTNQYVYVFQK
jgi:ubiquinone/menaquinone biosynthesis C-methylase UbiE